MRERIQRILELVAQERLGHDDAAQLLEALSPKLGLSEEARPHVFGLLHAPDFGVDKITDALQLRAGLLRPSDRAGTRGFEKIDNLGRHIESVVETALSGAFGTGRAPTPGRAGRILRIRVEDADGSELNANLPLSLAEHAEKLIPPRAREALERQGISVEALKLLLTSNPQSGELMRVEDADGSQVILTVT